MRKTIIGILLVSACLSLLTGCSSAEETLSIDGAEIDTSAGYRSTLLFYESDDGLMIPVMKQIPWEEGIGRAALEHMTDSEANRFVAASMGLKNVLPEGLSFRLSIDDDAVATVDLIGYTPLSSAQAEQNMVTAIVNALTDFPSISQVQFRFDGKKRKALENGTKVNGVLSAVPLNVEASEAMTQADSPLYPVTLYYPNFSASLNVPVTRYLAQEPTLFSVLTELLRGPADTFLLNPFPAGTQLMDAAIDGDTVTIRFSEEFSALSENPELEQAALESIQLTAKEFSDVSRVTLYAGEAEYLPTSQSAMAVLLYPNSFR